MLVPLDLRLMTRPLERGFGFEGFRSESIDDNDEATVGGEAGGCSCAFDVVVVGMGEEFEADIAAPLVRTGVCPRD
jgi:hypothetical protein